MRQWSFHNEFFETTKWSNLHKSEFFCQNLNLKKLRLISHLPLSGVSVVIITLKVLVMTSIATLLSRPINWRWRGNICYTSLSILKCNFEVKSPSPCPLVSVACLESQSTTDNAIVAWLWSDGEGTTSTWAFVDDTNQECLRIIWRFLLSVCGTCVLKQLFLKIDIFIYF